jgi:hypothetical protein
VTSSRLVCLFKSLHYAHFIKRSLIFNLKLTTLHKLGQTDNIKSTGLRRPWRRISSTSSKWWARDLNSFGRWSLEKNLSCSTYKIHPRFNNNVEEKGQAWS